MAGDVLIFFVSFVISLLIRYRTVFEYQYFRENLIKFSILMFIWLFVFYTLNLYQLNKFQGKLEYVRNQIIAVFILTAISAVFFYAYPLYSSVSPKTLLLIFAITFLILWGSFRYIVFWGLSKTREIFLIIGNSQQSHQLFEELSEVGPQKNKILIYSDAVLFKTDAGRTITINPPVQNLLNEMGKNHIDKIIIDKHFNQTQDIINVLFSNLSNLKSEFYELQDFYETFHQRIAMQQLDKGWFIYHLKPGQNLYLLAKRALDIIFAGIGSAFLLALFPAIGLAIKIDSRGPVIYKQKRIGQNKKVFNIYKFRSMADSDLNTQVCAAINDKRVTRVGNFLRRTHLDEMPQLINIIKGDLTLVGPRPEQPQIVEQLSTQIPYYNQRHLAKPGLTGWAQINYPYCATLEEHRHKLQYDLYYLKNRSWILDIKILLKTINKFFPNKYEK